MHHHIISDNGPTRLFCTMYSFSQQNCTAPVLTPMTLLVVDHPLSISLSTATTNVKRTTSNSDHPPQNNSSFLSCFIFFTGVFQLGLKILSYVHSPCCIIMDQIVHKSAQGTMNSSGMWTARLFTVSSTLELGTGHNHPLCQFRCSLFIHTKISYEIFIQTAEGYETIAPMKTQGGSLCKLAGY